MATTVWILSQAQREIRRSGREDEIIFGRHAGQFVVIGATHRKRGRGKLAPEFAGTLRKRLREWQVAYPGGRTQ